MSQPIAEITVGMRFDAFYLLKSAAVKTAKNGSQFLDGTLEDRTGTIDFKYWDYQGPITSAEAGKVVKVRAESRDYQGSVQLTITNIRVAQPTDPYDVEELVPKAPIDENEAMLQVRDLLSRMLDGDYRRICETMLDRCAYAFKRIPAAKTVHHGFIGGLLMHTSYMMRAAEFYAAMYGELINHDLLIAGTFLHDMAKREEFLFSDLGIVTDYSTKGMLLGHLVMGAEDVGEVGKELGVPEEKIVLLQHMLLSHHGRPEYGVPVVPMTAEAELLSQLDMIDSRMEIYRETYAKMEPGTFSERIFALERKIYKHS